MALAAASACSPDETPETTATPTGPPPRDVDVAALPAEHIVEAILRECHGELQGMAHVSAQLQSESFGTVRALAELPGQLRLEYPQGRTAVITADERALVRDADATTPREADTKERDRLLAIRTMLDVATLGPLRRAEACERLAARSFALTLADGSQAELRVRPRSLLLESMQIGGYDVRVLDHLHTPASWIIREVDMAPIGRCRIRLDAADFAWDPGAFTLDEPDPPQPATAEQRATYPRLPLPVGFRVGGEERPTTPQIFASRPRRLLIVDDPGTWPARADAVRSRLDALRALGQEQAGFAGLSTVDGRPRLVIGFRATDSALSEVKAGDGESIRESPVGRELVVFPDQGDFDQRRQRGERMLRQSIEAHGLEPLGPILCQPYLHLDEGAPDPTQLQAPTVRMSVAVR
jgi:hypothetical protein